MKSLQFVPVNKRNKLIVNSVLYSFIEHYMLISFPPIYEHKFTLRNWRRRESALWTEQCWPRSKSSHCNVSENEGHNTYIDVCPWRFDFSIAQAEADSLSEKEHNLNRLLKLLWNDLLSCNNKKSSFIFIWRLFSANIDKYDSLLNLIIN